jgi:uncharacterized protein (DUF697 family)
VALPVKTLAVFGLLRELGRLQDRPLLVAGAANLVPLLVRELTAEGDVSAVRTGGAPENVEALLYILGDEVTEQDERVLKAAHRARVPTIVVAAGRRTPARIPFVLATDVVAVPPGSGFDVQAIAKVLAHKLGEEATSLARRLPVLRRAVCDELIESFARKNAVVAAAIFVPGADLPVLTMNQLRLVLWICAAHGLEVDQQRLPEILATVGAGLGLRAIARSVLGAIPVAGWIAQGVVAYTGTRALGEAAVRYAEARTPTPQLGAVSASSS